MVAIALGEPERRVFRRSIRHQDKALINTVSVVEARIVLHAVLPLAGSVDGPKLLRLKIGKICLLNCNTFSQI
jgi:uncharacterized protein with PIN domain